MIQQMNLFNTTPEKSGFRLDYMEIYNWGTFNNRVYRISPQRCNSLLTGANASGKSTLVDALLTLLVPLKRQRFYNQSSGIEKKGARTEESYVLGCYGTQQKEGSTETITLKLRDRNARSVLLASFNNADGKVVTLFQIRYFIGQELKTIYGIAKAPLEIGKDFAQFDSRGDWRKQLEKHYNAFSAKKVIDFCNGPYAYAEKMCLMFNMRSNKALTLFNQIVGVKILDDLNSFIRNNMLDEEPAEEQYTELHDNFHNLMEAKINIDKTREQINMLKPINDNADKLHAIEQDIRQLEQNKSIAAYWFASRIVTLSEKKMAENEKELQKQNDKLKDLTAQLEELNRQRRKIEADIDNDEVSRQIASLTEEIKRLTKERDKRTLKAEEYNKISAALELPENPLKDDFEKSRKRAGEENLNRQGELEELSEKLRQEKNKADEIKNNLEENAKTIKDLEKNKNNISGRVSEIREEILRHTGATPDDIPFIGELIRVKDSEREWEPSIERILHNFALRLIVPEKYYHTVNEYVNSHNLNGRIVYHRYQGFTPLKDMEINDDDDNRLIRKIEFKPDNRYVEWVEDEISQRYNYACVDSLDEFDDYSEKAVTKEGLIKSVGNKHEKDDRRETRSRDNYVLGWENKEKIAFLTKEICRLQDELKDNGAKIKSIEERQEGCRQRISLLNNLLIGFDDHEAIDWMSCAQAIEELEEQKKKLEAADNKGQALREELKAVEAKVRAMEKDKDITNITIYNIGEEQKDLSGKRLSYQEFVNKIGVIDMLDFEQQHPEMLEIPLYSLENRRNAFYTYLENALRSKSNEKNDLEKKVIKQIMKFKRPSKELAEKYKDWNSDVSSLPDADNTEFIEEYQKLYSKLKEEDLISYENDFNQYLQDTMNIKVNSYKCFFEHWEADIDKAIDHLNRSLREIVFNKDQGTYIQLTATKKQNAETKEFCTLLRQAIPNVHEVNSTTDGRQRHFEEHIEPFMKKLEDGQWRSKVTDVRSWFTYRAEEFYQATGSKYKTYESMGQLSGGEKAQLTYTILGSAIAYQFGFTESGLESSFRFIAIDEAFKAQDEDKARYLLDLCNQLHLQLLVVTPSDNIHIVENNISFVHYVERKGDESVLYNMPIVEYKEEYKRSKTS